MANKKKFSVLLLILSALLCMSLLSACQDTKPTDPTTTLTTEVPEAIYTITVKTAGGLVLEDVGYYVYDSVERNEIMSYGSLNEDGVIIFTAPRSNQYILVLKGVPEGYDVKEMYELKSTKLDVVLTASVITEGNATERVYKLGDVITDFTVVDTDGNSHTISEILKTKEAVVLNFWYTNCGPCKQEFPFLQKAYELYQDKLEVIAMDPEMGDSEDDIAQFKANLGLTFPMAKVEFDWITAMKLEAYPTTVIIDRYGVICLIESGKVVEEGIFEGAFNHFTADNYVQKLVTNIEELDTLQYPEGHQRNPMQTNGAVGQFELKVEFGKEYYCNITRCDDIIFKVNNAYISVIYNDNRYEPDENGVITFQLSCKSDNDHAQVIFCNDTEEDQTVTVMLEQPPGTISTPIDMTYGDVEVQLEEGRNQPMYYTMTADKRGFVHLTLTGVTEGVAYEIEIENLNSMLKMLFSTACVEDVEGNYVAVVPVAAGDKLQFAFMSIEDKNGVYPAVTFQTVVSYSEHGTVGSTEELSYTLTFKDVEGLPMAGITATFTVNGEAVALVSDEKGVITIKLPAGSYMVQIAFPEGYTADASQYLLTPDAATKEVTVRLYEEKEITYTIHVQDHDGLPVVGAIVTVGSSFVVTDENGNAVFTLPAGSYVATVVPPQGYIAKEDKYAFGVRPDVTIVIENGQSSTMIPYTVTVVDGRGKPFTEVVVRFYSADGSTDTMVVASAEGVATATLVKGNYSVELIFQKSNMRYEKVGLELTGETTAITIEVAPCISGSTGQVKPTTSSSTYDAYYVQVGSVYVEVQPLNLTYFLFKPTQTGTYKIYTNKAGAAIENWQTTAQTTPNTSGVENNVFTLEVTELGKTYVIGIDAAYDVSGAILTVFRVPDCVVDPFPITPNLPQTPFVPYLPSYAVLKSLDFTGIHPLVLTKVAELGSVIPGVPAVDVSKLDGVYNAVAGDVILYTLTFDNGKLTVVDNSKGTLSGEYVYTVTEGAIAVTKSDGTACSFLIGVNSDGKYTLQPTELEMPIVLGADGYYHLRSEDGPVILIDLLNKHFGISILELVSAGKMVWYTYDEDGYPIYKKDYTASMNAYLAIMEPTKGLYPLTQDLYTMIKQYGDHVGWWDPASENYLFASVTDGALIPGAEWRFLTSYIYIDPALCQHAFTQWTLTTDGTAMTRRCPHCMLTETHLVGKDCCMDTAGEWIVNAENTAYTSSCTACGQAMTHVINNSCDDATCSRWTLAADGLSFERTCSICGTVQKHVVGVNCLDAHFGPWELALNGLSYQRNCTICGAVQTHTIGTGCRNEHFGQWTLAADGLGYERTCSICAAVQKHITNTDCRDEHFGQWTLSTDNSGYERTCTICGSQQKHITGTDCREEHFGKWTVSADGMYYERSCKVCATVQKHVIGTDCETHYSAWTKSEDGKTATRTCAICGKVQTHTCGTDCEAHYSAWTKSEDGKTATRTCAICGNVQTHTCGTDCEGHYGEWTACADGVNQERTCAICGNKQTQAIPTVPDQPVTPTPSDPEEQDPAEG